MPRSFLLAPVLALAALASPDRANAAQHRREQPPAARTEKTGCPEAPGPGEIRVKAESYEGVKDHMEARGTVDLCVADMRIEADKADVYEDKQPNGAVKHRFVAQGNVVFIRGDERLAGDRLEMDDIGHGFLENAIGYVEPGVFIEGRRIERVDDKTYRVTGGKFTSCAQPNPRWKFSSREATIHVDDKITARDAVFRVKGVPAFYLPYIYYPIERNGRSTGFLMPHFGHSSTRGFDFGTGFFWAMGRSADQTFYFDDYSRTGFGVGHELRWTLPSPSRGTLRTYVFEVKPTGTTDYDIDWNALQMLPGNTRATLNIRKYSNLLFQQRYQDSFNLMTTRTQRWSGSLEHDFKVAMVSARVDSEDTYFGERTQVREHLPSVSLRRFPRQIGWGNVVFGLDASAEQLRSGNQDRVDTWSRYDFKPSLSRPFTLSFLEFNPSVTYRYTRYGATNFDETTGEGEAMRTVTVVTGPPLERSYFETGIEMRGPTFSRVFDTPGFFYSDRLKHTIGPEVSWQYVTRVEDTTAIPKFDYQDWVYGTNQIQYAIVQRFYAKRRGPTGKPQAYEFFSWRLMQTYYAQIKEGQNNFDLNYSSSAFGPGGIPEHLSPIASRMSFRPSPGYRLDYQLEYDVNFKQLSRMGASANVSTSRASLSATWSRRTQTSLEPANRVVGSHTLRGNGALEVLPKRLFLEGSVDYDLVHDILYQARGRLRYAVQCCGFTVENVRVTWNDTTDSRWHFGIELANIGSMGNFLGAEAPGARQGLGGYR